MKRKATFIPVIELSRQSIAYVKSSDRRNGITYIHNSQQLLCLIQVHRQKSKHQLYNEIRIPVN